MTKYKVGKMIKSIINNQPTVEAIPVEWLKRFFYMRGGDLEFSVMMKEWDYYYGIHEGDR